MPYNSYRFSCEHVQLKRLSFLSKLSIILNCHSKKGPFLSMGEGIHYQTAAGLARHTRAQAHTVMHSVHTSQPPEPPVPTPALQHCQTSSYPVSRGNGVPSSLRPGKAACPLQLLLGPGEVSPSPVPEPATSVGTHSSGMGPGERLDTQPPLPVPWKQNHQHLAKQCLEVLATF